MDIFAIAMQATMEKIVNATWMNVLLIYAQQDRYVMIMPVGLRVFGKITEAEEVYLMVCIIGLHLSALIPTFQKQYSFLLNKSRKELLKCK